MAVKTTTLLQSSSPTPHPAWSASPTLVSSPMWEASPTPKIAKEISYHPTPTKLAASSPHRALRVLHAITPSKLAGAETFLMRLLRRAPSDEFVNRCLVSSSRANDELLAANLPFDRIGIGGKANLLAVPRLAAAAIRFQADVIHTHLSTASWWAGWLDTLGGPPSIGHVHGFTSARWHRRQSHLIACSQAVKQHLVNKGIEANRITVLHYPLDANDLHPTRSRADVRNELGADTNTPVVGTFAHLSAKKGYRELIQAAALVLNTIPEAQFWCFGEGPLRAELEQTARRLGIADRFKLFGFRRDVANLMPAIDVMCLPSHKEPFGLVYIEAALAAKPVIACDAGGAPEIITHNETGLLIPPPSPFPLPPSALASALFTLLDNPDYAARLGQAGHTRAVDLYNWDRFMRALARVYERVLDETAGCHWLRQCS